ncbi:MAG: hypothetical protein WA118_13630 [Carboxydocellales bacterium]
MRRGSITSWQIAATYIGTVVGAGFASGQEILQFFTAFGGWGLPGIIITTLGFSCLGYFILYLGHRFQTSSHQSIFLHTCGPLMGRFIDGMVTLFLFGAIVVMLAGVGAIFQEHLGLPASWGVLVTMLLSLFTVIYGLPGVMTANSIIIPFMVILILGISAHSLNYHDVLFSGQNLASPELAAAPHWLLAALLYLSYNLILSVPVLASMGKQAPSIRVLWRGALIGALGLGLLSLMLTLVQLAHFPEITHYQVPMLFVVQPYSKALQTSFALVLWAEIFTTLIANLYGFAIRLSQLKGWSYQKTAASSLLVAASLSGIGFSTLVGTVYPLLGYAGLIFLLGLLVSIGRLVLGIVTGK